MWADSTWPGSCPSGMLAKGQGQCFTAAPPAQTAGQTIGVLMNSHAPHMLLLHAGHPPLRVDEGGAVRVGKSRISLDSIVEQYENGMTPEDIVRAQDTLVLADVHAVIAYYLRHQDEVRTYLKRREEEA